jgi:hypothetical protein
MKYSEARAEGGEYVAFIGDDHDYLPTITYVNAWRKASENDLPKCKVCISDVNYSTDPKDESGVRQEHYLFSAWYGGFRWEVGTGLVVTEIQATFPYDWFNPETKGIEPGYIQAQIIVPDAGTPELAARLAHWADRLLFGYNHMLDGEYAGSRNEITVSNEDATFSILVTSYEVVPI